MTLVFGQPMSVISELANDSTQEDIILEYHPCTSFSHCIKCENVPVDDIRSMFQREPSSDHLCMFLKGNYCHLPDNFTVGHRFETIEIHCTEDQPLVVNSAAFHSTLNFTKVLKLKSQVSSLDLKKLNDFSTLETVGLFGPSLDLQSIPLLPTLQTIIVDSPGFEQWYPPERTPNLTEVSLSSIQTTEEKIDGILNTILYYNQTLIQLCLDNVGLTRFPHQIEHFTSLEECNVIGNNITLLAKGSVKLPDQLDYLYLSNNSIQSIEPGAFQGIQTSIKP